MWQLDSQIKNKDDIGYTEIFNGSLEEEVSSEKEPGNVARRGQRLVFVLRLKKMKNLLTLLFVFGIIIMNDERSYYEPRPTKNCAS